MPNTNPCHVVTGKVRLSYEHIMKPYKSPNAGPDDEAKFSVTVLVPKTDTATKALLDAGIAAAKKRGIETKKYKEGTPTDRLPTPIWDGDGFRADGYTPFGPECKGMWVFTASCSADRKPAVVDASGNSILDASEVYSGIWGRFTMNAYPYNRSGSGISFGLLNFQKLEDDEPLGGFRSSAAADFGDPDDDDWL